MAYCETRKNAAGKVTSVKWVAEVVRDGKKIKERFPTRQEAEVAERQWRAGKLPDPAEKAKPKTLLQALALCEDLLWPNPAWRKVSASAVRQWAKHLGGDPELRTIDYAAIEDAARRFQKAQGLTALTMQKYLSNLNKVLRWSSKRGLIGPPPLMPWPEKISVNKRRDIRPEEELAFRAYLAAQAHRNPNVGEVLDFIDVCLATGMRRGEVLGLKPDQLQGDVLTLHRTKNGRQREVVLTPEVQAILERRLPWKITPTVLRRWFNKAKEAAGLGHDTRLTLHSTRHAAATRLIEAGTDIKLVQDFLGHERITTTSEIYAHVTTKVRRETAAKLAAINAAQRKAMAPQAPEVGASST